MKGQCDYFKDVYPYMFKKGGLLHGKRFYLIKDKSGKWLNPNHDDIDWSTADINQLIEVTEDNLPNDDESAANTAPVEQQQPQQPQQQQQQEQPTPSAGSVLSPPTPASPVAHEALVAERLQQALDGHAAYKADRA